MKRLRKLRRTGRSRLRAAFLTSYYVIHFSSRCNTFRKQASRLRTDFEASQSQKGALTVVRIGRIELPLGDWQPPVLPLNYIRI
jgi:hypothetical protein